MEQSMKNKRVFLHISNVIISVLCIVAIAAFFVLPLWSAEIKLKISPELAEAITGESGVSESVALAPSGKTFAKASLKVTPKIVCLDEEEEPKGLTDVTKTILEAVIESLRESELELSFTFGLNSADTISSVFSGAEETVNKMVDNIADQIIKDLDGNISDTIDVVIKAAVKSAVKIEVGNVIEKELGESEDFDQLLRDIDMPQSRIDELVEKLIDAIMAENATVKSVADTAMSVADEIIDSLKKSPKYADKVKDVTDEEMDKTRARIEEALGEYADENGSIRLKDMLVTMILEKVEEALNNGDVPEDLTAKAGKAKALSTKLRLSESAEKNAASNPLGDMTERFKSTLKDYLTGKVSSGVVNILSLAMTVIGVLVIINILALAYPVIRSLTKIKAKNPGFHLALPIIFGLLPYTLTVLIPGLLITVLKGTLTSSVTESTAGLSVDQLTAIVNGFKLTFSSCTVVAFVVAIILFVYSFVYGHFRRSLKQQLNALPVTPSSYPYGQPYAQQPYGQPYAQQPYRQPNVKQPYGQPDVRQPYAPQYPSESAPAPSDEGQDKAAADSPDSPSDGNGDAR